VQQIDEVAEVLARPKIKKRYPLAPEDGEAFLHLLRQDAALLPHRAAPGMCRDPDDDSLLGCAVAGAADYLVTGDEDLLAVGRYRGLAIVTAREFLESYPPSGGAIQPYLPMRLWSSTCT
jgi:predicted nucleic acid-binding protein